VLYLESSAAVKLYLEEPWSAEMADLVAGQRGYGSNLITRTEVVAAIAKAGHEGALLRDEVLVLVEQFSADWAAFLALDIVHTTVIRAGHLALRYGLRAYDAVHLASALGWQEAIGEPVTFATFDRALHRAAGDAGLVAWPERLEA
jgi:predicted nucleic acid-binding protein